MTRTVVRLAAGLLLLSVLFITLSGCGFDHTQKPGDSGDVDADEESQGGFPVVINEVCAKNTYVIRDPEDHAYYDWIELYNSSSEAVSLGGYGISDKKSSIKHVFASDVVVPAGGYLLLWACGSESMTGKSAGGVYLPFAVSNLGETLYLFSTIGTVLDKMSVPALEDDVTFGYTDDGEGVLARLAATPGRSNSGAEIRELDESVASFSHESGFYEREFTLQLTVPAGYRAYYTLDCTEPSRTASREFPVEGIRVSDRSETPNQWAMYYTGIIDQAYEGYSRQEGNRMGTVDKCTVVRVVVYDSDGKQTDVITKSYFVGYQNKLGYENMSVVSLVSEPTALYGDDGLFTAEKYRTKGSEEFEQASERQTNFAYFDANGKYVFDQKIGMRLHGTSSRAFTQKSLTLFARRRYGNSAFEKAIVGEAKECHSMVLRTDGNTKLQEGFLQSLVSDRELSTCAYTPTVVFVDGEYYGVYNLYERFSDDYVEQYYGIDKENVYIVKKGSEGNTPEALSAYQTFYNWAVKADLSLASNWEKFCSQVDVQSLADYLAAEVYLCNADWSFSQNIALWRAADTTPEDPANPYADGRWRFVLYDLDISAGAWAPAVNREGLSSAANSFRCDATYNGFTSNMIWAGPNMMDMPMVQSVMKSGEFRRIFTLTFTDLVNVNFETDRVLAKLSAAMNLYAPNMPKHFARFGVPITSYERFSQEGSSDTDWKIKTYFGSNHEKLYVPVSEVGWRREINKSIYAFFAGDAENGISCHADYAIEDLKEAMGLVGDLVRITLRTEGEGGALYLNGVTAVPLEEGGTWSGSYYTDYAPTVTAVAAEGYHFVGWSISGDATLASADAETATLTSFTGAFTLTAHFAAN